MEEPPTGKPGSIGVWRFKCGISCHSAIQVVLKLMKFCEDGWFREITDKRTLIRPLPIILLILTRKQSKISYFRRPKADLTEQGASSIIDNVSSKQRATLQRNQALLVLSVALLL